MNDEEITLRLKPRTAAWLRNLLTSMQIQASSPEAAREMLALYDEIVAQLPEASHASD